jgi:hypothetical protein
MLKLTHAKGVIDILSTKGFLKFYTGRLDLLDDNLLFEGEFQIGLDKKVLPCRLSIKVPLSSLDLTELPNQDQFPEQEIIPDQEIDTPEIVNIDEESR